MNHMHQVFFTLKNESELAAKALVEDCYTYLKPHKGVRFFAAGVVAREYERNVNDRDFHVSLTMMFDSPASHDDYQESPVHKKFISLHEAEWAKVRVFDSRIDEGVAGDQ